MAAVMNVLKRSLTVSIVRGADADGNTVTRGYVYSNVKPNATPAQILAAGTALGSLFDNEPNATPAQILAAGTALGSLFDNELAGLTVIERASLTNE